MIKKLAKQYVQRNNKFRKVFTTLNLLIVFLLICSITLSSCVSAALEALETNYSIIGVIEYVGTGYPNALDEYPKELIDADENLKKLLDDDSIMYYEAFSSSFAYVESEKAYNRKAAKDYGIYEIVVTGKSGEDNVYTALVLRELFSLDEELNHMIKIDAGEYILNDWEHYIVHGKFYYGGAYDAIGICEYPLYSFDDNTEIFYLEDEALPSDSVFYTMAACYDKISHSSTLISSEHVEDLLEFNQGYLILEEGDFPKENECIITRNIANALGKKLGDSISFYESFVENKNPYEMYNGVDELTEREELFISGIAADSEEYENRIYANRKAQNSSNSWTLGQIRIKNEDYLDFQESFSLPSPFKLSYYDQGYSVIAAGLENIQKLVTIIAIIAICSSIAFILLFGFLLLKNIGGLAKTMRRLGNKGKEITEFFERVAFNISKRGLIFGTLFGSILAYLVMYFLLSEINSGKNFNFSNMALSSLKSISVLNIEIIPVLLALLLYMLFLFISVYLFGKNYEKKKIKKINRLIKTKSCLFKNSFSYTFLSVKRDGARSFAPLVLLLIFSIIFSKLPSILKESESELDYLKENTMLNAYITDYHGSYFDKLFITQNEIDAIGELDNIEKITKGRCGTYNYLYTEKKDGTLFGPGLAKQPKGSFAIEEYVEHLAGLDMFKACNNISGASDFIYTDQVKYTYLDGYDDNSFERIDLSCNICAVSKAFATKNNIELGDSIVLEMLYGDLKFDNISYNKLLVVCIFEDDGLCNTIFTQSSMIQSYYAYRDSTNKQEQRYVNFHNLFVVGELSIIFNTYSRSVSYQSASICVLAKNLESVKARLLEDGYSQPNKIRNVRLFIFFNDKNYLTSERSLKQKIDYMRFLFPAVYIACILISGVIAFEAVKAKRKDSFLLHNLGANLKVIRKNILLPQLILSSLALMLSIILLIFEKAEVTSYILIIMTFISYLVGAFVSFKNISIFNKKKLREDM